MVEVHWDLLSMGILCVFREEVQDVRWQTLAACTEVGALPFGRAKVARTEIVQPRFVLHLRDQHAEPAEHARRAK